MGYSYGLEFALRLCSYECTPYRVYTYVVVDSSKIRVSRGHLD